MVSRADFTPFFSTKPRRRSNKSFCHSSITPTVINKPFTGQQRARCLGRLCSRSRTTQHGPVLHVEITHQSPVKSPSNFRISGIPSSSPRFPVRLHKIPSYASVHVFYRIPMLYKLMDRALKGFNLKCLLFNLPLSKGEGGVPARAIPLLTCRFETVLVRPYLSFCMVWLLLGARTCQKFCLSTQGGE